MKIAIIEDNSADSSFLNEAVSTYMNKNEQEFQIKTFVSSESFWEEYSPGMYKIILIDIFLDDMNGMELARSIRKSGDDCGIIFTTVSDEFAVASYDVGAVYYLLKPVDKEKLDRALSLCMRSASAQERYVELICNRLPVRIPFSNIYHTITYRNTLHVYTKDSVIKSYITFQNFIDMLDGDPRVLICSRGTLVNMDHITGVEEHSFILDNDIKIQIKKRGGHMIKTHYLQYRCSKIRQS